MAITTLDGALAGMRPAQPITKAVLGTTVAGRPYSLWPIAGQPGAGSMQSGLNGAVWSSSSTVPAGAIPHYDPVSGNAYLARFSAAAGGSSAAIAGTVLLCDRLWSNTLTVTATAAETIVTPTWPARDINGSTNGEGVCVGLEVNSSVGAGAPSGMTFSYVNSTATGGTKTGNQIDAVTASSVTGSFYRFGLAAGDTGVRSISAFTKTTSMTSGTIALVAYRVIAMLEMPSAIGAMDALTSGFPRLYNGTCPFLIWIPSAATSMAISGTYIETQG